MTVLQDSAIARELGYGNLTVEPINEEEQLQPNSLDIRLGKELYISSEDSVINSEDSFTFKPNEFYLGHSVETIHLPDYLCAQLTGRSTVGRMGLLVHATAGWIDSGFNGELTFELYNLSQSEVEVPVGERIAQLIFFETEPVSREYNGQYSGQEGITRPGEF